MTSFAVATVLCGCARWTSRPSTEYVTVETDSRHDTELARKDYNAARKCMEKHLAGKECDYEKAEKLLKAALSEDVRFGPAHHSLGVVYLWQDKLYLAAWEFEYAARLMPDRFEPLNNLGLVYESAGKLDQAKSFYSLAREKAVNNPEVIGNLARVSVLSGEPIEQVRPVLEDIIATDTRPEWRRWAEEKLALSPSIDVAAAQSAAPLMDPRSMEPSPKSIPPTEEELPLLTPPSPDAAQPIPAKRKVAELPDFSGETFDRKTK